MMHSTRWSRSRPPRLPAAAALMAALLATAVAARPVRAAEDPTDRVSDLDRRALGAFEDLDFEKARSLLKEALAGVEAAHLGKNPVAARSHLYLGMVLFVGFAQRAAAVEHFRIALDIQPEVTPPRGMFNPEAQQLFEQTKSQRSGASAAKAPKDEAKGEPKDPQKDQTKESADEAPTAEAKAARPRKTAPAAASNDDEADIEKDGEEEEEDDDLPDRGFMIAVGVGSGGGMATGRLDMNGIQPNNAPGRFGMSETVHTTLGLGYFVTQAWLVSVEGRLQLMTGATPHCPTANACSSTDDFALAGLVKVTRYFFSSGALQPFLTLGLGGGRIRQRVEPTGLPDCGRNGNQQCYDTVPGGPFFGAGGGGLAYQAGHFLIQAAVTANVGYPSFMLNIDATLGLALLL